MRSPRKPGYEPLTPAAPSWVGTASADAVSLSGSSSVTISDRHFDGIEGRAIYLLGCDQVTIERCTFANCWEGIRVQSSTNVTIRDCAFWDIGHSDGEYQLPHPILFDGCDTVTVEDCWFVNPRDTTNTSTGDVINLFKTDNGIVQRNYIMGDGTSASNAGIIVGDGEDAVNGGGDNNVVQDNVLIDATITAIGTNNIVRRNVVLNRGLVADVDGKTHGILTQLNSYPSNPIGPTTVTDNTVRCYNSTGQLDPEIQFGDSPTVTASGNPVAPLIDEYSRWDPTGHYGWEG